MRTEFPFTLPRGYVTPDGAVHREGVMRLATGRDELEPLRDPLVRGPDDPRLTMLVLARVVRRIGTVDHVTVHDIESLFAADLAYLQDFYSAVNFGDQRDYDALVARSRTAPGPTTPADAAGGSSHPAPRADPAPGADHPGTDVLTLPGAPVEVPVGGAAAGAVGRTAPTRRAAIHEMPSPRGV